jgi:hypothetical protein
MRDNYHETAREKKEGRRSISWDEGSQKIQKSGYMMMLSHKNHKKKKGRTDNGGKVSKTNKAK